MPVKFTPLVLSVSLASPMILGDKLHHTTLAEPLHMRELPKIPGLTVSVSSLAVSGSNVTAQSSKLDAYIADADLVLPLDGIRAAADRRAGTANLCTVYTGRGTAYVLGVPMRLKEKGSAVRPGLVRNRT
jgi:hypothetical protein